MSVSVAHAAKSSYTACVDSLSRHAACPMTPPESGSPCACGCGQYLTCDTGSSKCGATPIQTRGRVTLCPNSCQPRHHNFSCRSCMDCSRGGGIIVSCASATSCRLSASPHCACEGPSSWQLPSQLQPQRRGVQDDACGKRAPLRRSIPCIVNSYSSSPKPGSLTK